MKQHPKLRSPLTALGACLLILGTAQVQAATTHWVDSTGAAVKTGNGGCWLAMNGTAGLCTAQVADSDHDGVPDNVDKCPNTPAGAKVDANGCIAQITFHNIAFALNKAELTAAAKQAIDATVPDLVGNPQLKSLTVTGYTDSTSSAQYNLALSKRRAEAVKTYLAGKGIAADKITAVGMGESHPAASNKTAAGRAQNRRVEISVHM